MAGKVSLTKPVLGYDNNVVGPVELPVTPATSITGQTLNPFLTKLQGLKYTLPEYTPIASKYISQTPVATPRPPPEYFQNLFASKIAPVQAEFFGPGGTAQQATGAINERGMLTGGTSGVAGQLFEQTVTEPYSRRAAEVQNQINVIRAETELQLSQFDAARQDEFRKFSADLEERDREYGMKRVEAQANIDSKFLDLEAQINQAIASGATQEEISRLDRELNTYEIMVNSGLKVKELEQEAGLRSAELAQRERAGARESYITGLQIPGFISTETPFEELGIPRPLYGGTEPKGKYGNYYPTSNQPLMPTGSFENPAGISTLAGAMSLNIPVGQYIYTENGQKWKRIANTGNINADWMPA